MLNILEEIQQMSNNIEYDKYLQFFSEMGLNQQKAEKMAREAVLDQIKTEAANLQSKMQSANSAKERERIAAAHAKRQAERALLFQATTQTAQNIQDQLTNLMQNLNI